MKITLNALIDGDFKPVHDFDAEKWTIAPDVVLWQKRFFLLIENVADAASYDEGTGIELVEPFNITDDIIHNK